MKNLYLWFYCLPLWEAFILVLAAVMMYLETAGKHRGRLWWKVGAVLGLGLWLMCVCWATLAGRSEELAGQQPALVPLNSYWTVLRGGNPELVRANFMNALLFLPGGLLLAELLPERRKLLKVALACTVLSLAIEFAQYFGGMGLAETDDVLHNALGGWMGALAQSKGPVLLRGQTEMKKDTV